MSAASRIDREPPARGDGARGREHWRRTAEPRCWRAPAHAR